MPNLYLRKGGKNYYSPLVDVTSSRASDLIIRHGGQNYAVAKIPGVRVGNLDLYDFGDNTWTVYGSPTISTDWADAFGGKSLYLNGSSYLQKEGANLLLPQTFTLECRVKTGGSVSGYQFLFGALRDGIGADFIISIRNGKFHLESIMGTHAMNTTLSTNTVYHAALCCDSSNNYYFFVNGVLDKAGTLSSTRKNNYPLTVGACSNRNYYFTGYLDEIRISSVCRWTENFTPPTKQYTLDGNTLVLLRTK